MPRGGARRRRLRPTPGTPPAACPVPAAPAQAAPQQAALHKTLRITGMMCPHCEATVKKALEALDGVTEAAVSHEAGTALVTLSKPVADETAQGRRGGGRLCRDRHCAMKPAERRRWRFTGRVQGGGLPLPRPVCGPGPWPDRLGGKQRRRQRKPGSPGPARSA